MSYIQPGYSVLRGFYQILMYIHDISQGVVQTNSILVKYNDVMNIQRECFIYVIYGNLICVCTKLDIYYVVVLFCFILFFQDVI